MTLVKFGPFKELENFNNKVQSLFNNFPDLDSKYERSFYPKIDISADEKNIFVEAEIPGIKKADLKLSLKDNVLTLKGEKVKYNQEEKKYFRAERFYGEFSRSLTIPGEINPDTIEADFENGLLKISIEKINEKKVSGRLIEVK